MQKRSGPIFRVFFECRRATGRFQECFENPRAPARERNFQLSLNKVICNYAQNLMLTRAALARYCFG